MNQYQQGMSLIELMVSLVISTMILAGVMQVFVSSQHTYSTEEALSGMQENARFAEKKMSKAIRVTGFAGCSGTSSISMTPNVVANPAAPANNFINGLSVTGFDSTSGSVDLDGDLVADISGIVSGTDVFSVNTAGACGAQVVDEMSARGAVVKVANTDSCGWDSGDYLVITNCTAMDVFRLSATPSTTDNIIDLEHNGTTNSNPVFSTKYDEDTVVFGFINTIWFVKNNPDTSKPALYKKINAATAELVVNGVEDLQVRYGFDNDGDYIIDELKTAAGVGGVASTEWKKVISIEISLLMASDAANLVPTPQDYYFWDDGEGAVKQHFATDNRIYYVFTRNVTMRNLSL